MKILVVDDSSIMRKIVTRTLRQAGFGGHDIEEAENGVEALAKIDADPPDVVLTDWNMPEMNGYEFLCNIREDSKCNDLNVMMVTTESEISQMAKALEAGANEYLMKPFTKEMIAEKLEILGLTS